MNKNISKQYWPVIEAAEKAGRKISEYFGQILETEEKSTVADFKTKADSESEQIILEILHENFPGYDIHAEETGKVNNGSDHLFIIDPLDGTNNFVLGIPNFNVSIALLSQGKIVFGVIHHPILKQTVVAEIGKGTWLGDEKLEINSEDKIERSTIGLCCGYLTSRQKVVDLSALVYINNAKRLLTNWAPTLDFCLLAMGRIEAVINYENDIYDFAAGKLIVTEAGGLITDWRGNEDRAQNSNFLASNNTKLHQEIIDELANIKE